MAMFKRNIQRILLLSLLFAGLFLSALPLAVNAQDSDTTASEQKEGSADAEGLSADAGVIAQGKTLFNGNCKQCHAVWEKGVGPQLSGVTERQSVDWLVKFIRHPKKMADSGDAYAADLFKKYAPTVMTSHDFFKDEQIKSILSFVAAETAAGPPAAVVKLTPGQTGGDAPMSGLVVALIAGLSALLVLVLGVLLLSISVLTGYMKQNKNTDEADLELVNQKFDFAKVVRSSAFTGMVALIFVAVVGKTGLDELVTVGVQQGYAPEQPIPFSHKLHAGEYEIDCKYCHTGVLKGKSAGIPSPNICMNCHNKIRNTAPNIQKIFAAIENDEPIRWVRVHNLPDLAYFNHAQHVQVGGLDCENCHGDVKNMEVVQQQSLLTMGWCVDCHRTTDVNAKGNAYYDNLVELHDKSSKTPMKVENIGGLECAKCHY